MKILTYIAGAVSLPLMVIALVAATICVFLLIARLLPEWLVLSGIAGLALGPVLWAMHDSGMMFVERCEQRRRERGQ